ncbi:hypothetical protein CO038_01760 [Candidatus Pacearchaeota archaeon CG_4_9_14_0_2_um_filter_39_13]|nr:hypothetical protein [Candidatus Pacearchaeota archaeon]OIO43507.1 MAG: hypothetical protein AUJ64_02365 [Candidatus Pacearchaeota archaeon CG1_02_39_14]PJC44855.1 MAG: hypothetical protein CO038_01760 [Candidatus Pacearchaeota archaeon CG_4_9_14_0_2_um_filter_39_13]
MKKRVMGGIFVFLLLVPLVSAQLPQPGDAIEMTIDALKEVLTPIFEAILGTSSYDDFFFAKILLLLLLFVVISAAAKKVPAFENNKAVSFVIALVISLLAVRYISEEGFIAGILLPYGTLGIAIVTLLPFIIYFYFLHNIGQSPFFRRIAWIFYGIVFVAVWFTRPDGQISEAATWIYVLGVAAVAISFFFDKDIHKYFGTVRHEKLMRGFKLKQLTDLEADISKLTSIPAGERSDYVNRRLRALGDRHEQMLREL